MARLTLVQRQRLDVALDAGLPIPVELIYAARPARSASVGVVAIEPADGWGIANAPDAAALYASAQWPRLVTADRSWCDTHDGKRRSDLVGVAAKSAATIIERELRTAVDATMGGGVGGSACRGDDLAALRVDVKTTVSTKPQGSGRFTATSDRALGLGHHLLVIGYRITQPGDILHVDSVGFIPRWYTSDHHTSVAAESLRRLVGAGTISVDEALRELGTHGVEANTVLADALESDSPIPAGVVGFTSAYAWRLRFGLLMRPAEGTPRWVHAIGAPAGANRDPAGLLVAP